MTLNQNRLTYVIATQWNLGAFYLTEAVLNFGRFGPYLVLPCIYVLIACAEFCRSRSYVGRFVDLIACANMATFAFYGLNGFAKPTLSMRLFRRCHPCSCQRPRIQPILDDLSAAVSLPKFERCSFKCVPSIVSGSRGVPCRLLSTTICILKCSGMVSS